MRHVRLFAAFVAFLGPMIGGMAMSTLGKTTAMLILAGKVEESKLPWLTKFFLGHGQAWIFPMMALAFLVLLLSIWIHRSPKDEAWKRGAMLWMVTIWLSLVLASFGGATISWFLHVMFRAEAQIWPH